MSSSKVWSCKKRALLDELTECARRSHVLSIIAAEDMGDELRAIVEYRHHTLIETRAGVITTAGPVAVGIRYLERFLAEVPHPLEIAAVLAPEGVFHSNVGRTGSICFGHPMVGLSMKSILHQVWAALTFNMQAMNTRRGEVMNRAAAQYVLAHPTQFPLTEKGLFEAEPTAGFIRAEAPEP